MNRKYLDDIGVDPESRPDIYIKGDPRIPKFEEQVRVYGFNEQEAWSLNYAFKLWLYERLNMYVDTNNVVDTTFHKFQYKGETITFQDCIDRMIEGLKLDITTLASETGTEEEMAKVDDVLPLFVLCFGYLWW